MKLFSEETAGEGMASAAAVSDAAASAAVAPASESSPEAPTQDVKPTAAEPSEVAGETKPKTTLEAIEAVLNKSRKGPEPKPEAEAKTGKDEPPPSEEVGKDGKPEEGGEELLPIKQPKTANDHRWNRLLKEKKHSSERVAELEATLKQHEQKVQAYEGLEAWVQKNRMTREEMGSLFYIGELMKNDPKKAWAEIQPMLTKLKADAGVVTEQDPLDADIQELVSEGEISERVARQMMQERLLRQSNERRLDERGKIDQEHAQRTAAEAKAAEVNNAFMAWDAEQVSKDPDFDKKRPLVQRYLSALRGQYGPPASKEDALQRAALALKDANDILMSVRPPVQPTQPLRPSNKPPAVAPAPKNAMDIINNVLSRRGA